MTTHHPSPSTSRSFQYNRHHHTSHLIARSLSNTHRQLNGSDSSLPLLSLTNRDRCSLRCDSSSLLVTPI
ncbi:hypothetical protein BLNAU_17147 [Blattamonas nauphoetae]|uniref:Uncharacterized protein n=1 Tax=Blattamonas nauphoetae TaxID=2049346 RepID=A0ABQ9XCI6_9EUKA|nr:hypothetical protein BLNAU_17147 [Blattamonas nauphoetae]